MNAKIEIEAVTEIAALKAELKRKQFDCLSLEDSLDEAHDQISELERDLAFTKGQIQAFELVFKTMFSEK